MGTRTVFILVKHRSLHKKIMGCNADSVNSPCCIFPSGGQLLIAFFSHITLAMYFNRQSKAVRLKEKCSEVHAISNKNK